MTFRSYTIAGAVIFLTPVLCFFLADALAPSESQARKESTLGLAAVYPQEDDGSETPSRSGSSKSNTSIVFVHGLGANPETAWSQNDVCWISDFLPQELVKTYPGRKLKLFMFKYESFWLRKSSFTLHHKANDLFHALNSENLRDHNLILVGHSYGGLVIKRTLTKYMELKSRVKGVVFLGTPHLGTAFQSYGLFFCRLLSPFGANMEMIRMLGPDGAKLVDLQGKFSNHYGDTPRKYFYETRPETFRLFGLSWFPEVSMGEMVSERSATHGASEQDRIPLTTDHRGMNRFSRKNNSEYKKVRDVLADMLQAIPHKKSAWQLEMLDTLSRHFEHQKYDSKGVKSEDSAWFFDLEQYKTWSNSRDPGILWISGPIGSGKSTVYQEIIRPSPRQSHTIILHFRCVRQFKLCNTPLTILASWTRQLLDAIPEYIDLTDDEESKLPLYTLNEWDCQMLISRAVSNLEPDQRIIMAIDALDECILPAGRISFLDWLAGLLDSSASRRQDLKVVISIRDHQLNLVSRGHSNLTSGHPPSYKSYEVKVSRHNRNAIELFVAEGLKDLFGGSQEDQEFARDAKQEICDKSSGVFLWTSLALSSVLEADSTPASRKAALRSLPPDNDLYHLLRSILDRVPDHRVPRARVMMFLATSSARPLLTAEFSVMLAAHVSGSVQDFCLNLPGNVIRDVNSNCFSLLSFEGDSIAPFHGILREFLIHETCPERFRTSLKQQNPEMLRICIKTLTFLTILSGGTVPPVDPGAYVADYLFLHLNDSTVGQQMQWTDQLRVLFCVQHSFQYWMSLAWNSNGLIKDHIQYFIAKSTAYTGNEVVSYAFLESARPIHVGALLLRSRKVFETLILDRDEDVASDWFNIGDTDDLGQTALHWAAGQNHDCSSPDAGDGEIIECIIEQGLAIDKKNTIGRTPLHLVVQYGRLSNLRALLEQNSDVNCKDVAFLTPLQICASSAAPDHLAIRNLLIRGAHTYAQSHVFGTPLHGAAAQEDGTRAITELLNAGVFVDTYSIDGLTPLMVAIREARLDNVKLLLENGASVTAQDIRSHWSPLHVACISNQIECVKLLLKQTNNSSEPAQLRHVDAYNNFIDHDSGTVEPALGFEPASTGRCSREIQSVSPITLTTLVLDMRSRDGSTPLHQAALHGNLEITHLLVATGADLHVLDNYLCSPLHLAIGSGSIELVRYLLKEYKKAQGFPARSRRPLAVTARTPVQYAAALGCAEILDELLTTEYVPFGISSRANDLKATALHEAAAEGHMECVKVLIKNGSSIDIKDTYGRQALHLAVLGGHTDIVKVLLTNSKAEINSVGLRFDFAFDLRLTGDRPGLKQWREHCAKTVHGSPTLVAVVHLAAFIGNADCIAFLNAEGADLELRTSGMIDWTPLHIAASVGGVDAVKCLLNLKADTSALDNFGNTPMLLAIANSHVETFKLLLKASDNWRHVSNDVQGMQQESISIPQTTEEIVQSKRRLARDVLVKLVKAQEILPDCDQERLETLETLAEILLNCGEAESAISMLISIKNQRKTFQDDGFRDAALDLSLGRAWLAAGYTDHALDLFFDIYKRNNKGSQKLKELSNTVQTLLNFLNIMRQDGFYNREVIE